MRNWRLSFHFLELLLLYFGISTVTTKIKQEADFENPLRPLEESCSNIVGRALTNETI
jgi:hypothetical protein